MTGTLCIMQSNSKIEWLHLLLANLILFSFKLVTIIALEFIMKVMENHAESKFVKVYNGLLFIYQNNKKMYNQRLKQKSWDVQLAWNLSVNLSWPKFSQQHSHGKMSSFHAW